MSRDGRVERLRQRTLEARDQTSRPLGGSRSGHWIPGDLLVLAVTGKFAVEWVVLEVDSRTRRLRVVAADFDPRTGSTDVAVQGASFGSLTLRCGSELWIDASALRGATVTGRLSSADVELGRQKCAEVAARSISGSVFERETDGEPEYQARMVEVQQARQALLESIPAEVSSRNLTLAPQAAERSVDSEDRNSETGAEQRRPLNSWFPWRPFANPYPAAAGVLLASTLALSMMVGWQHQEMAGLIRERSTALEEQASSGEPPALLPNLPLAFFPAVGAVRGAEKTLRISKSSEYFLLVLGVKDPFPSYRLEIGRHGVDVPLITSDDLTQVVPAELSIAIPRASISPGHYWLRLSGLRDESIDLLKEYALQVEID